MTASRSSLSRPKERNECRDSRSGPDFYLGVDGGGTQTTAWVCDQRAHVLGRATAGPANPVKVGLAAAQSEILAAATRALATAGSKDVESICLGLAGADRDEIRGPLMKWLRRRLPARFHLVTIDAVIALEAARGPAATIVVIAGTGSIACTRDPNGKLMRAGGWGAVFDDAGSGFDIGRQGVRAALRALDENGPRTRLTQVLPRSLRLGDPREIVGLGLSPAEIAALAPLVIRCARNRDLVASAILDDAGRELSELALALIRRLKIEDRPVSVVCAGGLLQASPMMRGLLARHLVTQVPLARVTRLRRQPVEGALALALSKGVPRSQKERLVVRS